MVCSNFEHIILRLQKIMPLPEAQRCDTAAPILPAAPEKQSQKEEQREKEK